MIDKPGKSPLAGYRKLLILFVFLLSLFSITYQYLMLPDVLEGLIKHIFEKHTGGKIELEVKKASLFYGLEIENCRLSIRKTKEELLYFKYGRFSTFLPGFLAGEASIRNFTLEDGRLHINYKKGRWNWGKVFNPHGKITEEEEEEEEGGEAPNKISLLFPLRLHAKIDLQNFSYYMKMDGKAGTKAVGTNTQAKDKKPFALKVEDIDLHLGLITRTFSEIPLSLEMAYLFETLVLAVNPKKDLRLDFESQVQLQGSPKLTLFVFRERTLGETEFHSRFFFDGSSLQFRNKRGEKLRLDWQAFYDIFYDSQADRLVVKRLEIKKEREAWFSLGAAVNHISSTRRSLQLDIKDALLDLGKIGELIAKMGEMKKIPVSGKIKIARLSLFGGLHNLRLRSKLEAQDIFLKLEQEHRLEKLLMDLNAQVDLHRFIPLQEESTDYQRKEAMALGIFHYLDLREFEFLHEKGRLQAKAHISEQKGTKAEIYIDGLRLGFFTKDILKGKGAGQIKLYSSSDFKKTAFDLNFSLSRASYILRRSRSLPIEISLGAQGKIDFKKGFKLDLDSLDLRGKNIRGQKLLKLRTGASLSFDDSGQSFLLKKSLLSIDNDRLYPTLPQFLKESLRPFRTYMENKGKKNLSLHSPHFHFEKKNQRSKILGQGRIKLPALNLNDLDFVMDIQMGEKDILIKKGKLRGLQGALAAHAQGKIETGKDWKPALDASFRVHSDTFVRVHENISVQGDLQLNAKLLAKNMKARISSKNLNIEFLSGECQSLNHKNCKSFFIHQMALDNFQINHLRHPSPLVKKRLSGPQNNYERSYSPPSQYNFHIGRITSSHNPRGEYAPPANPWHYIGRPGKGRKNSGLRAILAYQNNTIHIKEIEIKRFHRASENKKNKGWKKSGIVRGKDIYFNLFDLQSKNMSAAWKLKIQNLDLEPFLPRSRSNYNGVISADSRGQIRGFEGNILEKIKGSFIVHQISPEFGGFITRILVPAQVAAFLVRNTLEVPSIKLKLQDGLAYSYIQVQRARIFPGALLSSSSEEIKQERLPIAQFLKQARKEIGGLAKNQQKK